MGEALEITKTFTEDSLPDLDVITLAALELFEKTELPVINVNKYRDALVLGSGNAIVTARAIFSGTRAVFADETNYEAAIFSGQADGAYIFSASGSKHAVTLARALDQRSIPTTLITNTKHSPAEREVPSVMSLVFPKNREPYTYNTSTYMGMFLAATQEDPALIRAFIETSVRPIIPENIGDYEAYFFILPEHLSPTAQMFLTKFHELFGSKIMGRIFSYEQTKHAKTVIQNDRELFISFGVDNDVFGSHRLHIPLPPEAGLAAMMAIGYFMIGHIQKHKPPMFKESIARYMKETSELFGQDLEVIVD